MASGDVFHVQLKMNYAGVECRPGFYIVEGGGGGAGAPCEVAAAYVAAALGTGCLSGFSNHLTLEGIIASDVQPATAATATVPMSALTAGDIADDNPPSPQNSMLLQWHTAKKGGKGVFNQRGRTYVPGIYSTGQISGFLIADLQLALQTFGAILVDAFISDGTAYQMHCVSFNETSPRTIKGIEPVTSMTVDNQVDIIRARRPGTGI